MAYKFCTVVFLIVQMIGLSTPSCVLAAAEKREDKTLSPEKVKKAQEFIEKVGNEIIQILVNKNEPLAKRKETFRVVLKRDFDIPAIGQFVLAEKWRGLSDGDRKKFLALFENAIVDNYSAQFDNYNNETLTVRNGSSGKDGGAVVFSVINRQAGSPPLSVSWVVFPKKDQFRVLDIKIEGVSMSITQRNDYKSIIQSNGGKIDALLDAMEKKHAQK